MDFCGEARIFKEHLALVERADAFRRLHHAGRFESALQLAASTVNGQIENAGEFTPAGLSRGVWPIWKPAQVSGQAVSQQGREDQVRC